MNRAFLTAPSWQPLLDSLFFDSLFLVLQSAVGAAPPPPMRVTFAVHRVCLFPQPETTVGEVRKNLEALTEVQSKRQKLIGLGKKPNPPDDASLGTLQLKNPTKFMMVAAPRFLLPSSLAPHLLRLRTMHSLFALDPSLFWPRARYLESDPP